MKFALAVLFSALLAASAHGASFRCENVWTTSTVEAAFTAMFNELLSLQREISEISDPRVQVVVIQDFRLKFRDMERIAGRSLREEFLARAKSLNVAKMAEEKTPPAKEKTAERIASRKIDFPVLPENAPLEEHFRKSLGRLTQLDHRFAENLVGSPEDYKLYDAGVMWSRNERFVAFRTRHQNSLYDTEQRKFLDVDVSNGRFYGDSDLWVEVNGAETKIRSLLANADVAIARGAPVKDFASEKAIVLKREKADITPGTAIRPSEYALLNLETGRELPLGSLFAFTEDMATLIRSDGQELFEILDVASSRVIRSFAGKSGEIDFRKDFLSFHQHGQSKLIRVSDQKIFDVPSEFEPVIMSPNGRHLLLANEDHLFVVMDLETGKEFGSFYSSSPTGISASLDSKFFLIASRREKPFLVDFDKQASRPLPIDARSFSTGGRWLYQSGSSEVFDLQTMKVENRKAVQQFVGPTNLFLSPLRNQTLLVDASDPKNEISIGEGRASASPSGRFIIGEDSKQKIILYERKEPTP